jgi:hypothetical protein
MDSYQAKLKTRTETRCKRPGLRQALVLGACLLSAGCASMRAPPAPQEDWRARLERDSVTPRIIVQVCWPTAPDRISFSTLRYRPVVGSESVGVKTAGRTTAGQPVFEKDSAFPSELLAQVVSRHPDRRQFVFKPGGAPLTDGWSAWRSPDFVTDDMSVTWSMLHGRKVEQMPVPDDAPRLRSIMMSFKDYLARVRGRREDTFSEQVAPC